MEIGEILRVLSDAGILGGCIIVIWALATGRLITRAAHEDAIRHRDALIAYERAQKERAQSK